MRGIRSRRYAQRIRSWRLSSVRTKRLKLQLEKKLRLEHLEERRLMAIDFADLVCYPEMADVSAALSSDKSASGSGTTRSHRPEQSGSPFILELLHVSDQEAGIAALDDAPRFSAVLNALRNQDLGNDGVTDNTLTLSSGDAFIPGLFFDASASVYGSGGIADIQIQNELGLQAIALGNHEFDKGPAVLAGLISGSAPGSILGSDFSGTSFPYLSGNLDFSPNSSLAPLVVPDGGAPQAGKLAGSAILNVNGEQIGIVAATTPTLAMISSPGNVGITPSPFGGVPTAAQLDALAAIIQADVDALLAANPTLNKVILLAHMQRIDIEFALASRLQHVDIIVAGGSNTRLTDSNDRLRAGDTSQGEYPTFITNAGGRQTAVVNTDGNYKYVGRLVIEFDPDGHLVPASYDPLVSGVYAADDQGVADLNAAALVDPEIQTIVDEIRANIISQDGNYFGITTEYLNGIRSGGGLDGVRSQETNLGNLTADANLDYAQSVDSSVLVSIKNGGGIRASIGEIVVPPGATAPERFPPAGNSLSGRPEGGISEAAIRTVLAFNNGLSLLTLTRDQLLAVLEHSVAGTTASNSSSDARFPQIAGIQFSFDVTRAAGDRIRSASIVDGEGNVIAGLRQDGLNVGEGTDRFRIVTLNFLADGGDGYPFPSGAAANRVDLASSPDAPRDGVATFAPNGSEQDAFAEYLAANFATPETAYSSADGARNLDTRIQNLSFRSDAVPRASIAVGGVTVNAPGQSQRSQVTTVNVRFNVPVTAADEAFRLRNLTTGEMLSSSQILVNPLANGRDFILTFAAGTSVQTRANANSLADGNYQLDVDPSRISSTANPAMDDEYSFGDQATDNFFRLFGDDDGDGDVDLRDYSAFRRALTAYDADLDFNGDGTVNRIDFGPFRANFSRGR